MNTDFGFWIIRQRRTLFITFLKIFSNWKLYIFFWHRIPGKLIFIVSKNIEQLIMMIPWQDVQVSIWNYLIFGNFVRFSHNKKIFQNNFSEVRVILFLVIKNGSNDLKELKKCKEKAICEEKAITKNLPFFKFLIGSFCIRCLAYYFYYMCFILLSITNNRSKYQYGLFAHICSSLTGFNLLINFFHLSRPFVLLPERAAGAFN